MLENNFEPMQTAVHHVTNIIRFFRVNGLQFIEMPTALQQCQLPLLLPALPVVFPWSTNRCLERKLNFYATQPTTCDFQASLAWKRRPPTCQTTACLTNDISQWNWETKRRRRDCRTSCSLRARPSIHFLSRLGRRRWCRFCLLQGRLYHHHLLIGLEWHSSDLRWSCGRSLLFNLGPFFA